MVSHLFHSQSFPRQKNIFSLFLICTTLISLLGIDLQPAAAQTAQRELFDSVDYAWAAYNDCVYQSSNQYIGSNVTTFGVGTDFTGDTSGVLLNQATGASTGITATLSTGGSGVVWQPSTDTGGSDPASGTDAYTTFHGLADMTGVLYYGSTSSTWYVDLTLTGLDPSKTYTFATSAVRDGGSTYADRISRYTISGIDAATNASTSGVTVVDNETVAFITGTNYDQGYVARWTGIQPGADGEFVIRAQPHTTQYKAYAFDVFMVAEESDTPVSTVSFQQGVNSYTGTVDTYLESDYPSANNSTDTTLIVDYSPERHILLRFDDLFGSEASQIPVGAFIQSASLQIYVTDESDVGASLHRMLQTWNDTDTWNTWVSGIDANGVEAAVTANTSSTGSSAGFYTLDVTKDIQYWANNPSANFGWAWLAPGEDNSWQFTSSEGTPSANRPKLTVTYLSGSDPTITISGTPLSAFRSEPGYFSDEQSYTVLGTNLTNNILITAPTDFEISTTSGSGFGSSVTLTHSGGSVPATPIYVRFNRATAGSSSGVITHTSSGAATREVSVSGTASTGWVAYNDMNPHSGDANDTNVTEHNYDTSDGALVNYETGETLPVTITGACLNGSGGIRDCDDSHSDVGGPVNSGTDAASVFGTSGEIIVDMINTVEIDSADYDNIISFDNLDPTKEYAITLSANRDNTQYEGARFAKVTIQGADTYTNASSSGVVVNSESSVSFSIGYNTANGYVAKWTGITSGTDGSFSIKSEWDNALGSGTYNTKGYAITALKLEEISSGPVNHAPDEPVLVQPGDESTGVALPPTLEVTVTDPDDDPMDVTFYGRIVGASTGENFTLVALPDTQNYSTSYPDTFTAQTQWIVDHKTTHNIVFVTHLGDIVNTASSTLEYTRADTSMDVLDNGNVNYSVGPGNHDVPTTLYNTYFGISRFSGKSYYGGYYGSNNDNNYSLFSASGLDFILINLQYQPGSAILDWADALLKTHSDRHAIVASHSILNTNATWSYQAIYDALKDNPNLFLMLCGHMHSENMRTDVYNENTIYSLLSDYQDEPNGGNGYLRLMEFSPTDNKIYVKTYSPTLGTFQTDVNSQFELDYEMAVSGAFEVIGTVEDVASGDNASIVWNSLTEGITYEWYAVAEDASRTTQSDTWEFTAAGIAPDCYQLTLSHTGEGTDPVATPTHSMICPTGEFIAGEEITFSGAAPAEHYQIGGWTGTDNDSSTDTTNTLTMPAANHSVSVNYEEAPNNDPVLNLIGDKTVNELVLLSFTATASDLDLDNLTFSLVGAPTGASITTAGVFSWTPTEAQGAGDYPFTVKVCDDAPTPGCDEEEITVTVNEVNLSPVLASIGDRTMNEMTTLTINASATDNDLPANTLTFSLVGAPAGASITSAGVFSWTPTEAQGADIFTFTIKVCDNAATPLCDEEEISVTVNEVNRAPVLDSIGDKAVVKPAQLTFTAAASDADLPANTLTFSLVAAPTGASITNAGVFSWTPSDLQSPGDYTFTVKVCDNGSPQLCDEEEITVTVYEINTDPVAVDDTYVTNEDTQLYITAPGVLSNDSDADGDTLTASVLDEPDHGTLVLNSSGSFIYSPDANFFGQDTFTYTLTDQKGGTDVGEVTITVNAVNDSPIGAADVYEAEENKTLTVLAADGVLVNDTDIDSISLQAVLVSSTTHGTLSLASNGSFTYIPTTDYIGSDSFTYRVYDGQYYSPVVTVSITVIPGIPVTGEYSIFLPTIVR